MTDRETYLDVGQLRLRLLGHDESESKAELIADYWHNEVRDGDLIFPVAVKDVLKLADGVATASRLPAHLARCVTAELVGLRCLRCGGALEPVPVKNRTQAQRVWQDLAAASITCVRCWKLIEEWIGDSDRPLPEAASLVEVLAAHGLRGINAYGDVVAGQTLISLLGHQNAELLTWSVLVPHSATGADALIFQDERPSYYIARLNWKFAGEGVPGARRQAFELWLDERLKNILGESFDDVENAATTAIQDEVLRFIHQYLEERSFPLLDAPQQARVRQLVADHWGRLNLGHFFSIAWSAVRSATDIKAVQPMMGRTSVAGYLINEFGRGIEKMLSGEWERREYGPHRKLPHASRSLTLFRTILGLDILKALPSDIEDLRPAADPREVHRHLLEIIERRRDETGEDKARLMASFTKVYGRNLQRMEEPVAFSAALHGMDYLEEIVPAAIVQGVAGEIVSMREAAEAKALKHGPA